MTTLTQPLKTHPKTGLASMGTGRALLLSLPIILLSAFLVIGGNAQSGDPARMVIAIAVWLAVSAVFFFMLRTGKTHRYRSILFIVMAFMFSFTFILNLIETRGSMSLSAENIIGGEAPFCHLAIPMILIPAALTRTIIFPGSVAGAYGVVPMLVLWIGSSLALGRGWCSWACFYGGFDEGFSCLARKASLKKIDRRWTYLPFAMLLFIVVASAAAFDSVYCAWICPFKTVTEYAAITDFTTGLQAVIFLSLFAGLVVILPILTKKRTQCGLFCPFGAMQSFTNKVNIYDVRIDPDKCTQCGICTRQCPTFSLDESSLQSGKTLITCTKCGKCIDDCPRGAIHYHIKGTKTGLHLTAGRVLFLYPAYLFMVAFLSNFMVEAIWRIVQLVATGSLIS
jgi:ferredoxin-type protein NapH